MASQGIAVVNSRNVRVHDNVIRAPGDPNGPGNVGIGTAAPGAKLQVTGGDVYVTNVGTGLILKSPNGSCFRITVSDAGALGTSAVTCP